MNIELTNRLIKKMAGLKQNIADSMSMSILEPYIDGSKIQSGNIVTNKEARELLKTYSVNNHPINPYVFDQCIPNIDTIHAIDLLQNPYLKNIVLKPLSIGDLKLETAFYAKNELAIINEPLQTDDLLRKFPIGIFDDTAFIYVLKNKDFVWMSICPMEINTMYKHIKTAKGKVLVLGGGLAYYPYMISLKEDVSEITIIESDERIFHIIEDIILPQFKNHKTQIILCEAEQYIKNNSLSHYDTVFFDIWEDNISGAEYMKKFAKYELKYPEIQFQYWLEDSILDSFIINIAEYFSAKLGTDEYQDFFCRVAPDIWEYMESIGDIIKRPSQLDYYLTRDFAKKYVLGVIDT